MVFFLNENTDLLDLEIKGESANIESLQKGFFLLPSTAEEDTGNPVDLDEPPYHDKDESLHKAVFACFLNHLIEKESILYEKRGLNTTQEEKKDKNIPIVVFNNKILNSNVLMKKIIGMIKNEAYSTPQEIESVIYPFYQETGELPFEPIILNRLN